MIFRLGFFLVMVLICLPARASDGTTLANGASQNITAYSVCKAVTNNSGQSEYIPTTSSGEWASFYNTSHSGVSIGACGPQWTIYSNQAFCSGGSPPDCPAHPPSGSCSPSGSYCCYLSTRTNFATYICQ